MAPLLNGGPGLYVGSAAAVGARVGGTSVWSPPGPALLPLVQTYVQAVETADGAPMPSSYKAAINDFVTGCQADGIWSAIRECCIFAAASTINGARIALVGGNATAVNLSNSDLVRGTGIRGNNSNKYLTTAISPQSTLTPGRNLHCSAYVTQAHTGTESFRTIFGAIAGTGTVQFSRNNGTPPPVSINFRSSSAITASGVGNNVGMWGASGTVGSGSIPWRFGSSSGTSSQFETTPASQQTSYGLLATANGTNPTNARIGMFTIGNSVNLTLLASRQDALFAAFAAG